MYQFASFLLAYIINEIFNFFSGDEVIDPERGKNKWFSLRNTLMRLKLHNIARFFGKEIRGNNAHLNNLEETGELLSISDS